MEIENLLSKIKLLTSAQKEQLAQYIDHEFLKAPNDSKNNMSVAEEVSSYDITNSTFTKIQNVKHSIDVFIERWQGFLKNEEIDTDLTKLDYLLEKHS